MGHAEWMKEGRKELINYRCRRCCLVWLSLSVLFVLWSLSSLSFFGWYYCSFCICFCCATVFDSRWQEQQKRSSGQTEENSSLAWLPSLLFSHRNGLVRRTQSVLKKGVRTFCIDQLNESERIKMPHVWKFWHIIFYDWTTWLANKYVGRIKGGFFIQFYRGPNWWIYYVAPLFTKGFVNEPSMTINFIVIFQKTLQYKQRGARLIIIGVATIATKCVDSRPQNKQPTTERQSSKRHQEEPQQLKTNSNSR